MKWEHVSKGMAKQKYKFSSEQCRLKIKNLKERHLKLQKKLKQSGSENPNDNLEEDLEETFGSLTTKCVTDSGRTRIDFPEITIFKQHY